MDVKEYVNLLHNLKVLERKIAYIFEQRLGISLTRFQIIKYLHKSSSSTSKQISQSLEIDAAAVTRHIKILEKEGYVIKRRNENNNREVLVELSEKAHEEIRRCERETTVQDIIGNEFTEKDLKDLVSLLKKFNENFK